MKTLLGTEVDLGPGHIVLDGVLAPRERGTAAPIFSAHVYCDHGRPSQLLLSSCVELDLVFFSVPVLRQQIVNRKSISEMAYFVSSGTQQLIEFCVPKLNQLLQVSVRAKSEWYCGRTGFICRVNERGANRSRS